MVLELRPGERAVVAMGVLLALLSIYLYLTDFHFLTGVRSSGRRVGAIGHADGDVKREFESGEEFRLILRGQGVFNGDLLFTGPTASAQVELDDGSQLTIEPGSMVRLEFEKGFTLPGISRPRSVSVNVVTGAVASKPGKTHLKLLNRGRTQAEGVLSVKASETPYVPPRPVPVPEVKLPPEFVPIAKVASIPKMPPVAVSPRVLPSAIPSPIVAVATPSPVVSVVPSAVPSVAPSEVPRALELTRLRILEPRTGTRIRVSDGMAKPSVISVLRWVAQPSGVPLRISLHKLTRSSAGEVSRKQVFSKAVTSGNGESQFVREIDSPGEYEWQIRGPGGEKFASARASAAEFVLEREFVGIQTENPLVGGEESVSNRLQDRVLRDFDIRLRWKPFPDAENYEAWIAGSPTSKTALRTLNAGRATSVLLSKGTGLRGALYYRIVAPLKSGFIAISQIRPLSFDFLPPILVTPKEGAEVVKGKTRSEQANSIYFTWEKTNFTESYLFEFSKSPLFKDDLIQERLDENFEVIPIPAKGRYYWRVKSLGSGIESAPSRPNSFTVN